MAKEFDISRERRVSTNYNPRYSIIRFIPIEEIEDEETGEVENHLDLLNWRMIRLLHQIDEWTPIRYDGSVPLTTLTWKEYGTTTLWWLVLMYNGYMHPREIPSGVILKFPRQGQIDQVLNALQRNRTRANTRTVLL